MSPDAIQIIGVIFAPTGIVMLVASGIIYSMKRRHDKELIDAQSNADDRRQENENFAKIIDSTSQVNMQLISAFGDLSKQHRDTEKTHREIAQSQTTALDTQTQTIKELGETLTMSSNNHFKQMAEKLDSIHSFLETIKGSIAKGNREQLDRFEKVRKDIHDIAEKLDAIESVPMGTITVDKIDVAQTATHEDLLKQQTAKKADNQSIEDKE